MGQWRRVRIRSNIVGGVCVCRMDRGWKKKREALLTESSLNVGRKLKRLELVNVIALRWPKVYVVGSFLSVSGFPES